MNDYFVESLVFDERKVDLAKVRIAEVVVESKQEDQTTSGFELSDKEKSNALQRWHVKVRDRQAHRDLRDNLIEHVENFHDQGYARNSKQAVDLHVRVRLLQLMVDRLQERSLVDKTLVSVNNNSNDLLIKRDSKRNDIIKKLKYVAGDMQELLKFVVINPKICLVILDSAGLTTNSNDLKNFIKNITSIKKIIIDNLPHTNTIDIIERDGVLANHEKLKMFDGRSKLY